MSEPSPGSSLINQQPPSVRAPDLHTCHNKMHEQLQWTLWNTQKHSMLLTSLRKSLCPNVKIHKLTRYPRHLSVDNIFHNTKTPEINFDIIFIFGLHSLIPTICWLYALSVYSQNSPLFSNTNMNVGLCRVCSVNKLSMRQFKKQRPEHCFSS